MKVWQSSQSILLLVLDGRSWIFLSLRTLASRSWEMASKLGPTCTMRSCWSLVTTSPTSPSSPLQATGWSRSCRRPAGTSPSQHWHLSPSSSTITRNTSSYSLIRPSLSFQEIPTQSPGPLCPFPPVLGGFTSTWEYGLSCYNVTNISCPS